MARCALEQGLGSKWRELEDIRCRYPLFSDCFRLASPRLQLFAHSSRGFKISSSDRPRRDNPYSPAGLLSMSPALTLSRSLVERMFGDGIPHRRCSSRNARGPSRSSHPIRSAQRRPSKSRIAMIGRPVLDPRTGRPGIGVAINYPHDSIVVIPLVRKE